MWYGATYNALHNKVKIKYCHYLIIKTSNCRTSKVKNSR